MTTTKQQSAIKVTKAEVQKLAAQVLLTLIERIKATK